MSALQAVGEAANAEIQRLRGEISRLARHVEQQRQTINALHDRLARLQAAKRARDELIGKMRAGPGAPMPSSV